ncbi:MAG: glycosyltransferase family 2 protein [Gammaproteobacteria bacterium]
MNKISMDDTNNMTTSEKLPLAAIIPAFQPDNRIIKIGQTLLSYFSSVIIVNDGSDADKKSIFDTLQAHGCTILTHSHNQGKGAALKTAFAFVRANNNIKQVITLDADGQHQLSDVLTVARASLNNADSITLGSRHFDNQVPFRSRFGNCITRWFFKKVYGVSRVDTQTGLRVIPALLLSSLLQLNYSRYEYELGMLIYAAKKQISINQIVIETIYENNNASSHFRPFIDSCRIYKVLLGGYFTKTF